MTKKIIDFMTTLILILVVIFMAAALFSCNTAEEAKISDEGTETIIVENTIVENTLVE